MRVRFGRFLLDEADGALYRDGERVAVEPKPLALLFLLARHRPRLVRFDAIQTALWPNVTVARAARDRVISQARHAVGDDGRRQGCIETRRSHGLCFVARAEEIARAEPPAGRRPLRPYGDPAPLVGRRIELERLESQLDALTLGRGGVVVIEGEAGVGKSRLARELGARARMRHLAVHWTRSVPEREDAGPYLAWRHVLRSMLREDALRADPEVQGALKELAPLLPELSGGRPRPAAEPLLDAVQLRARWVDATARVFFAAAARMPRVVMLDDFQWADRDSLRIALPLVPHTAEIPLLLVVIWRSGAGEEEGPPELSAVRRRMARIRRCELSLRGLSRGDVTALLEASAGEAPPPALVDALHDRSDGNAFFVTEMIHLLLERMRAGGGGLAEQRVAVPPSIPRVLDERLTQLSPGCVELLRQAASLGRDVEVDVLARACGEQPRGVAERLWEAIRAGVLRADGDPRERVRFAHWLMVDHLAGSDDPRRARWHWEIAEALELLRGDQPDRWSEIASHRTRGLDAGDPAVAIAAARRAAQHAASALAYAEAARHLGEARRAQARVADATPEDRADLVLELGRALRRAGRREEALRAFDEAAAIARRHALPRVLARAALGFTGQPSTLAGDHKTQLERVLEALGRLGERDGALRARLQSRCAALRAAQGDYTAAEGLARQAVELARHQDDPSTLASTLRARNAVLVGDVLRAEERIGHAEETIAFAVRMGDEALALDAQLHRSVAWLDRGDVLRFRHEMSLYRARARELRHPLMTYFGELARVTGLVLDGRFGEAELAAEHARRLGRRAEHPDSGVYYAIQITQLRFLQGRLAESTSRLEKIAEQTELLGLRAALTLAYAETGRQAEARRWLAPLVEAFEGASRDPGWLSNVCLLALVAARARDAGAADRLVPLLEPYADCTASAFLVACNGSVAYFLGLLARIRGRDAEAGAYFEAARRANETMGCVPWRLYTDLAHAQLRAGSRPRRERARALRSARAIAGSAVAAQMPQLLREAEDVVEQLSGGRSADPSGAA